MASVIYDSSFFDATKGNITFASDTFKVMLVTSTYVANKGTHTRRSDITNEVSGTGYTAGGSASAATISEDTTNHRKDVSFASINWTTATITARGAVIYKSRGGLASADELLAYVDFGSDITSTAGTFALSFTAPYRFQN